MKAVITNDQGNLSLLKLRLVAEGANDRTLMLLLELQYPMIHRLHSNGGSSPGALPESLEVPIASGDEAPRAQEAVLSLCSESGIKYGDRVTIRSTPWEHASLLGVQLWILEPQDWKIICLTANGRSVGVGEGHNTLFKYVETALLDLPSFDVHPGTVVELTVKRGAQSEPFEALKLFEAFLSKTEAEATMYRTTRNCKSAEAAVVAIDVPTRELLRKMVERSKEMVSVCGGAVRVAAAGARRDVAEATGAGEIAGALTTALALVDGVSGAEHSWEERTVLARIVGPQVNSESEAVRKLIVAVDARQKVMGKPWPVEG